MSKAVKEEVGEGGEPVVDDKDVGVLTPSKFYEKNLGKPVIDFKQFDNNSWIKLDEANISDLPLLNNTGISEQIEPFCKEFDLVNYEDIFTNVPPLVADFGAYLCQCVVNKIAYQVAVQWPPIIPRVHPSIPSFVILLAKVLRQTGDPLKFFYFIMSAFFSKFWTQKTCLVNQYIVGICRCNYEKKSNDFWAIIDRDRMFRLYEVTNKGCVEKVSCQISKCYSNTDKTFINILDINQRNVCKFTPAEKEQIQLWDLIYSRQKVPFPFYMFSSADFYPDIYYRAFYNTITSNDTVWIHAILRSELYDANLWESLVKIFAHASKMTFLSEAVFAHSFDEKNRLSNESFDRPTHFSLYARALGKVYFASYFEQFFCKVAAIVDFHDDMELTDLSLVDAKLCEKVVFNVLKYIMQSSYAIPNEWRHAMNILRSYLNVKYNSVSLTTLGLSAFFGHGILVSFFKENIEFFKEMQVSHPNNFPVFGYILSIPFSLNIYGDITANFKGWNKRLENHFFPRWQSFLFGISDFKEENFRYAATEQKTLGYALDVAMRVLINPDFQLKVKDTIQMYLDNNNRFPTLCGINLCCLLSHFFVHCYDPVEKVVKKKKVNIMTKNVQLPTLPSFINSNPGGSTTTQVNKTAKKGKGMSFIPNSIVNDDDDDDDDNPNEPYDPFATNEGKPQRYFVPRSLTRSRYATQDEDYAPATMTLPDLPAASKYNPITYTDSDADESSNTFTPKELKNAPSKLEKQAHGYMQSKGKPVQLFKFESSLEELSELSEGEMARANLVNPVPKIPTKQQPKKKTTSYPSQPFMKPPSLPVPPVVAKPTPEAVDDHTDNDSDMQSFLKTLGSESEPHPPPTMNTQEKRKLMMMVPVDPATITNDPTLPRPKLYKRVSK